MRMTGIAAASVAGVLALGMAAAPATAAPDKKPTKSSSKTTVQFTKSTKTKLKKAGIAILAEAPAKKLNAVTFTMPASSPEPDLLVNTGAVSFARADRGVYMGTITFDLSAKTASYTQMDGTVVEDAFDIGKLKVTKKATHGRLNIAMGMAAKFNQELSTDVFKDGMFVAKFNTKAK